MFSVHWMATAVQWIPCCMSLVFSRTWSVTRRRFSAPSCAAWRLTPWRTPSTSSTAIPTATEPPSSRQTARRRGSTRSWSTSARYVGSRVCSHWDQNCRLLNLAARFNAHKKTCHILWINRTLPSLNITFIFTKSLILLRSVGTLRNSAWYFHLVILARYSVHNG